VIGARPTQRGCVPARSDAVFGLNGSSQFGSFRSGSALTGEAALDGGGLALTLELEGGGVALATMLGAGVGTGAPAVGAGDALLVVSEVGPGA
jgi:hypothetical protein